MPITSTRVPVSQSSIRAHRLAILCTLFSPGEMSGNRKAQLDMKAVTATAITTRSAERIIIVSCVENSDMVIKPKPMTVMYYLIISLKSMRNVSAAGKVFREKG